MHKRQREPIKKKYLIISIIGVIIFSVVLSFLTIKSTKPSKKISSQPSTEYKSIKKDLNHKFNQNGRVVDVKEERNINDKTSKNPHTVIIVQLVDKQTQTYLKTSYEAVQNNQATDDQKVYIYSIQKIIADQAKKLNNNYDVIQFVYKDKKSYIPVASSQKHKFLIKPVKISNESE